MENKQTAIEWLLEQVPRIETIASTSILEEAKQMEKEQMIDFANEFANNYIGFSSTDPSPAEHYYNETNKIK